MQLELYREQVEVAPGVTISLVELSPEAPEHTLLFHHGFGGNVMQWRYQIQAFGERNRVIAPELRGHGRSGRPRNGHDMSSLVIDLERLLADRQVSEPLVIAGHSFGGAIATDGLVSRHLC